MAKEFISKFHSLHGDSNPHIFCAKLTEVADDIKHIACVISWKDGTTNIANTAMKTIDIVWLRYVFDQDFHPDQLEDRHD